MVAYKGGHGGIALAAEARVLDYIGSKHKYMGGNVKVL